MDVMKAFEEYAVTWAEENLKPVPKLGSDDWNLAWYQFTRDVLNNKLDEMNNMYKSMQLKTTADLRREQFQTQIVEEIEEPEVEEEPELSDWEKVQQYLKKNK